MTVSAAELLGGYDIARRDLPWRNPGVTAWQILVSEFMLQQTPVARVQPSGSTGWRVGPRHRPRPPRAWPTCCGPGASRAHVGVLGSDPPSRTHAAVSTPAHRRRRPHRTDHDAGLSGQRQDRPVGYLQPFRETLTAPPPVPVAPVGRSRPLTPPRSPTDDDRPQHKQILDRSEALTVDTQTSNRF